MRCIIKNIKVLLDIHIIFFSLSFLACVNSNHVHKSKEECRKLGYLTFKGLPREAHKFKQNCMDKYVLQEFKDQCSKALRELILGRNLVFLKKSYGESIALCFSKNDLRAFLK